MFRKSLHFALILILVLNIVNKWTLILILFIIIQYNQITRKYQIIFMSVPIFHKILKSILYYYNV